jgi:hypothetical protein
MPKLALLGSSVAVAIQSSIMRMDTGSDAKMGGHEGPATKSCPRCLGGWFRWGLSKGVGTAIGGADFLSLSSRQS